MITVVEDEQPVLTLDVDENALPRRHVQIVGGV
jgi:hypothetical protein